MDTITFTDKSTGGSLTAADVNEIKSVVNSNAADKYKMLEFPAFLMAKDSTSPPADMTYKNRPALGFSQNEKAHFVLSLPPEYKEGTDIIPFIKFSTNADYTGAGYTVEFSMQYDFANVDGDFFGSDYEVFAAPDAYTSASDDTLLREIFNTIDGSSFDISTTILITVECTNNDFATDLAVLAIGFYYESDERGSTTSTTK